jgi:malate dehydrogenase
VSTPGRPAVRPGSGVIGEADVMDLWRSGRRKLHVSAGALVTHQAREAAERLGVQILDGPAPQPVVPVTDGAAVLRRSLYRRNPKWIASDKPRGATPTVFRKLAVVGAGGVGANTAHLAANASVAHEIVLIDVVPGSAAATALDLEHSVGITGSISHITGGTALTLVEDADVVVITAGRPRQPGMTRADLITVNARIVRQVGEAVRDHAPLATVIVVTNPLDEMTMEAFRSTGFPRERVIGMAGTLDSSRFRRALARAAGVDAADVDAFTLGSHGDEMVPITSQATIKGRPLSQTLSSDQIAACVADTVGGGGQVVALRQTGSATLAPAHATVEVLDALRGARAGAIPVSVVLEGEYGIAGTVVGVPCLLGSTGVIEIIELPLPADELAALQAAAAAVAARLA